MSKLPNNCLYPIQSIIIPLKNIDNRYVIIRNTKHDTKLATIALMGISPSFAVSDKRLRYYFISIF